MSIYPFLIGWGTFYLGTRVRSALWAVLGSLLAMLTVILVPYAGALLAIWLDLGPDWARAFAYASPATIVMLNETQGATITHTFFNFVAFGGFALLIRGRCLRHADRLLGRSEAPAGVRPAVSPSRRAFSLPRAPPSRGAQSAAE